MILLLGGIYLFVDAVASFLAFRTQPFPYQLVRLGRLGIGIGLIIGGL